MASSHLDSAVSGRCTAGVNSHTEDTLVRGVERITGLAPQAALDDDAQLLSRFLPKVYLGKTFRQRIVLHLHTTVC